MNLRLLLATASAAAVTALNAHAVTYGNYNLEALTGTGSNTSVCVFDFGTSTTNQYAFGYAYDGIQTGSDMLKALKNDSTISGLTINLVVDPLYGDYVSDIFYTPAGETTPYGIITDFSATPNLYPNYWTASGGQAGPTTWTSPWDYGISGRILADGSWDGFTQAKYWYADKTFEAFAPAGAFAAVPEPAALGLLALGGLALLRRRR